MYHPDPAAIRAPNASDCTNRIPARFSTSERLFTVKLVDVLPDALDVALGLAAGADVPLASGVGLAAGEMLAVGVAVTRTVAEDPAETAVEGTEEVVGEGVVVERPPAVAANLPANIQMITTSVIVAMNEAIMPASHVDLGAKNPAIIGGNNGTGKNTNW